MCVILSVGTGKLDVREAAANLPDEPGPLDEPDESGSSCGGDDAILVDAP